MSRENIAVEVCLTSNDVILGVDGREHPLPTFLDAGVPVVLATDDEGVSRIDLTHEYVRAATTYDLDYRTLKRLSRNSLHYAFLDGASLWRSRSYEAYAAPCRNADPDATAPKSCRAFLDDNAKAAAEWRLERAFARFESSYAE
jgi:adenosine deaminase/adenosine deaminase CECR1